MTAVIGPIGEIVAASLTSFVAETPREDLYQGPRFGSLVRTEIPGGTDTVFGIVAAAETSSLEPGRRPTAFWQSESELQSSQPQIFELLATTFTAQIVAHRSGERMEPGLPPRPPRIHGFVYPCRAEEIRDVTADLTFLSMLLDCPTGTGDSLVSAALQVAALAREDTSEFLIGAGRRLAIMLRGDYPRLQSILRAFR